MPVTVVRTLAGFDALAQSWRLLETQVPHTLPFQTFDWNRAWWTHFAVSNHFRHDSLLIHSFVEDDKLIGVIPLFVSSFKLGSIVFFRYIRPFGADPNLTEIRSPLVLPEFTNMVFTSWLKFISRHGLSIKQFQIIGPEEVVDRLIEQHTDVRLLGKRVIPDYILNLSETWDEFHKGLKRNIKESIRRCYNSLARENLKHSLVVFSESTAILAQLDTFYALHSARASAEKTVNHPDYFSHTQHRDFLKNLICNTGEHHFQVHLFCLYIDSEICAMRLGFIVGDDLYFYYSGYKPEYGKYSVMTTLVVEVMRWAMQKKLVHVNLSVGQDVSKTRWSPVAVNYAEYHFSNTSLLSNKLGWLVYNFKKFKQDKAKAQLTLKSKLPFGNKLKRLLNRVWLKVCVLLACLDYCAELAYF